MRQALFFFTALLFVSVTHGNEEVARDHEIARNAVARGELLPLSKILQIAQRAYPGKLLEVELDRDDGRFEYELEILLADGRVIELTYDGATGQLLESEIDD